jgi:hypothetical protein
MAVTAESPTVVLVKREKEGGGGLFARFLSLMVGV